MNRAERRRQAKLARKKGQAKNSQGSGQASSLEHSSLQGKLEHAVSLHNSGNLDAARPIYESVLNQAPDHPVAQHLLAIVCHQTGDNDQALERVCASLKIQPQFPEAFNTRGSIYMELGENDKALTDFDNALKQAPAYGVAKYNRGLALLQLGENRAAKECFSAIISEQPDKAGAHYHLGLLNQKDHLYTKAIENFDHALALAPEYVAAVGGKAECLNALGRADEARQLLRQGLELPGDTSELAILLAGLFDSDGDRKQAIALYQQGLNANSENPQHWREYGRFLARCGKAGEAAQCFVNSLDLDPTQLADYIDLAMLQVRQGQYKAAEASMNKALIHAPDSTEILNNLGVILRTQGKNQDAVSIFERIMTIDSENALALSNLASTFINLERYEDAESALEKSQSIDPSLPDNYYNRGLLFQKTGHTAESVQILQRAIELKPGDAHVHHALGAAFQALGDLDRAAEQYQQALDLNPDYAAVRRHLAFVRKHEQLDDNARAMQAGIENPQLSEEFKIHLAYGLGKVYEDVGLFTQAFNHYKLANSYQRSVKPFDEAVYQRYVDKVLSCYTERSVSRNAGLGYGEATPIFVVGMPRSGTTLVEQILSSHPEVFGAGELPHITRLADRHGHALGEVLQGSDQNTARKLFTTIGRQYMELIEQLSDKPFIVDKMPGNYLHVGLIKLILPRARIIHCRRSAEDTCLSIFKNYFTENGHEYKNDLVDLARTYNRYRQLMAHWHNLFPGGIYDIHYEKLIDDQSSETRKLLEHCGLDWNDKVMEFYQAERTVLTASSAQVRAPIYKDSIQSWRKFESQLSPLCQSLNTDE